MTWFKVDDGLPDSPDVVSLEESKHFPAAMGLWVLAGAWCAKHLTDGFVPSRVVTKLGCKKAHAEALVSAGMWRAVDGGYQFHNWLKYQPSKSDVHGKRDAARERMRRVRSREHECERSAEQAANVRDSRPVPTRPDQEPNGSPPKAPQGAGVPAADVANDSVGRRLWDVFDRSRATEYLAELAEHWPGLNVRAGSQADAAQGLFAHFASLAPPRRAEAFARLAKAYRADEYAPRDVGRFLAGSDLTKFATGGGGPKGGGPAAPAAHSEHGLGEVSF